MDPIIVATLTTAAMVLGVIAGAFAVLLVVGAVLGSLLEAFWNSF